MREPLNGGQVERLESLTGQLLTLREVMAKAGYRSYNAALRRAQKGRIPGGFMLDTHWRFKADRVEAWLQHWWDPADEPWEDFVNRNGIAEYLL